MTKEVIVDTRVFVIDEAGNLCSCKNEFYKTCPLRAANNLPCQEAIFRIMPIQRTNQKESDNSEDITPNFNRALDGIAKGPRP